MAQQTLPFIEGKYGWSLGESNWNLGMDENLVKFSFLFDRNLDGIVASLPPAVNGQAYFLTTDNRLYFAVGGIFYSAPTPKWFIVQLRSSGDCYQFNGTSLAQIASNAEIDTRLDAVELAVVANTAYTDVLRTDIATATALKGLQLTGFLQDGTGAVGQTGRSKVKQTVSVFDYMTPAQIADVEGGTTLVDVTAAVQAALTYVSSSASSGPMTSGTLTASYTGTSKRLFFPKGTYRISTALNVGAYIEIVGDRAILKQFTDAEDIFVSETYQLRIQSMQFVGGRHHINFFNANTNSTMVAIENCDFFLSRSYAIKTSSNHVTWTHLSCDLSIYKCRFLSCNKIIDNCCDSAVFDTCWLQVDKENFTASTAAIQNKGRSVTDPDAQTRMHIRDCFLIPDIGTEGVDRVNNVRWIDNYGSLTATHSRFGGEFGGMSICWNYQMPNTTAPWNTTEITFEECQLFAGPDARTDSCVIGIQGAIPNRITVKNCTGPVQRPVVSNLSSLDIPTFMSNFETASGRKAYDWFKVDITGVSHDIWAVAGRTLLPDSLIKYVIRGRQTKIRRSTNQSLANALANNLVSFDTTPVFDNVGAFDPAQPTRINMPKGCTKMRITMYASVAVDGAAKLIKFAIVNSSLTVEAADASLRGINADSDSCSISADVEGVFGSFWHINIRHGAAAALNLTDCRVSITPLDYSG